MYKNFKKAILSEKIKLFKLHHIYWFRILTEMKLLQEILSPNNDKFIHAEKMGVMLNPKNFSEVVGIWLETDIHCIHLIKFQNTLIVKNLVHE